MRNGFGGRKFLGGRSSFCKRGFVRGMGQGRGRFGEDSSSVFERESETGFERGRQFYGRRNGYFCGRREGFFGFGMERMNLNKMSAS